MKVKHRGEHYRLAEGTGLLNNHHATTIRPHWVSDLAMMKRHALKVLAELPTEQLRAFVREFNRADTGEIGAALRAELERRAPKC